MGCDIHTKLEVYNGTKWEHTDGPGFTRPVVKAETPYRCGIFENGRSYALFGVLADVRNYSAVLPLSAPRGWPDDLSPEVVRWKEEWGRDLHTPTWYTLHELLIANWDAPCVDRRVTRTIRRDGVSFSDGGVTGKPEEGRKTTYRELVGPGYLGEIEVLRKWAEARDIEPEHVRVVIAFDN